MPCNPAIHRWAGWLAVILVAAQLDLALPTRAIALDAPHGMVVAEHELAARAGLEVLKRGGNAIDAACATALAVGVTNPSSCGIGGGGFMLIYIAGANGAPGAIYALDYRERAPEAATLALYVRDGHPDENLARVGPLAVAVPGEIAGIQAALERFGTMTFSAAAAPAIRLARNGFPCGDHLASEIARTATDLARDPGLRAVFLTDDGAPRRAGDPIIEKDLAQTLEQLGDDPVSDFYHGAIAAAIVTYLKEHGGLITAGDLAAYKPLWRDPLSRPYRGFEVYAMPPPSSGGVVLEMLGMLEPGMTSALGVDTPPYLARLIEILRWGFRDRDDYADPDFAHVPIGLLLSPSHIEAQRARALHPGSLWPPPTPANDHGTSHLCVADSKGNIVSLTTTINTPFGARMMIPGLGIVLNDEMDDFAVAKGVANAYRLVGTEKNLIEPGKRPLSSMSPIIVTRRGKPVLALGGSGGPTIVSGVLQVMLDVLDYHIDPARAVAMPRIHEQGSPDVVVVEQKLPEKTRNALKQMGYQLHDVPALGAVSAVEVDPHRIRGGADPRKGGAAAGY